MNTYDRGGPGVSSNPFGRWMQRTDITDDSTITKMQHQYWVTKQALSKKLGKKDDECIIASDAELDAKLELFRSIQESCSYLQRVIDKYQERLCNLAQEENTMGRFLKEAGKQDKTRAGKMMSAVGKSLSYSGQQRIALRSPLVRLYQEVETFRQRAIEDTLQNVQSMEKARTEYRAALSWMKNVSQELDPDTSKQLERFRKVQIRVRRGKLSFDHQALDCLQKVDLLAAARCNMFSHALVLYQSNLLNFTKKSAQAYSTIANSFKGYQHYDFMVVRELVETSTKLAKETGGDNNDDKNKLLFFESDAHNSVEVAKEVKGQEELDECNIKNKNLLDIENDVKNDLNFRTLNLLSDAGTLRETSSINDEKFDDLFENLASEKIHRENKHSRRLEKSLAELDLAMDSFTSGNVNLDFGNATSLATLSSCQDNAQQPLQLLTSESVALLDEIFNSEPSTSVEWDSMTKDTFLPPGILKQSLGDAALGKRILKPSGNGEKKIVSKQKGNSWLDLFAELDPLTNNPIECLSKSGDRHAPA